MSDPRGGIVTLYFYSKSNPLSILIRLFTRRYCTSRPTPSHVGILCAGSFYEATYFGVRQRSEPPAGASHVVNYYAPDAQKCGEWLKSHVSDGYDFLAILFCLISWVFNANVRLEDHQCRVWDCSRLVAAAMEVGGIRLPQCRHPESPADLLDL